MDDTGPLPVSARWRWTLAGLFFLSGLAGLIYEVVWLRQFARLLGCTSYATATVLAAFMAGLALGGFLFGRWADRPGCRPLRLYAMLELLVAVCGVTLPFVLPALAPVYRWVHDLSGGSAWGVLAAKVVLLSVCVVIPTTLMGGTLPVISAFLTRRLGEFGKNLSLLYAWNTFGAVVGTLASGFVLLAVLGEFRTILVAVAGAALVLARRPDAAVVAAPAPAPDAAPDAAPAKPAAGLVLAAVLVSGFTALAYEVIWSRQLIMYLATSVYAFACMLAVFLAGIACGSQLLYRRLAGPGRPVALLAGLQLAVAACTAASLWLYPQLGVLSRGDLLADPWNLLWTAILLFPVACCFGMAFPTAARCLVDERRVGTSLGRFYAVNTAGNILGAWGAGFLLLPLVGSAVALHLLLLVNAAVGLLLLLATAWPWRRRLPAVGAGALVTVGLLAVTLGHDPFRALLEFRAALVADGKYRLHANLEGVEGTVTAFAVQPDDHGPTAYRHQRLWLNGIGMTELGAETKLMAHLPLAAAPDAKSMLVICFGMGSTVVSAARYPALDITCVELVGEVYTVFPCYHPAAAGLLADPRVHPVVGDGRNYLLLTDRRFDVITLDPPPPIHSAGTVNLYTREFFQLCRARLTASGVICLWVPLGTARELTGICQTFTDVFPNTHVWSGPAYWGAYLLGLPPGREYQPQWLATAFARRPFIVTDLAEFGGRQWTAADLQALYLFPAKACRAALPATLPTLTDDRPYTEYPLFHDRRYVRLPGQVELHHAARRAAAAAAGNAAQ